MWKIVSTTAEGDDVQEFSDEHDARRFYRQQVESMEVQRVTLADPNDLVVDCDSL